MAPFSSPLVAILPFIISRLGFSVGFHGSRDTVHCSRFTVHGPRSTVHGSRFTAIELLGKTQHGYSDAVQKTDAHGLFQALSSSHQTSSSTPALSSLVNVFTIRQTSQSHPAIAEEVNHGIQQVKLCWESTLHPGYVSLADLHSALYLNALEGGDSN